MTAETHTNHETPTGGVDEPAAEGLSEVTVSGPRRERLPDIRRSVTHKFSINGHEGYLTVGLYPDGRPGELFIKMAKQGSTVSGLVDTIGILTSLALQYGVPVETLARKFAYMRFEPSGWTKNEQIRQAHSITDYIFRWIGIQFGEKSGDVRPDSSLEGEQITPPNAP